jgi:methyltransferase, FkbM family
MPDSNMEQEMLEDQLNELFDEDIEQVKERERTAFDKSIAPFDETTLVLFGAGGLGRRTLSGLRQLGIKPLAFVDNNPNWWGKMIDGLRVLPPGEAVQKYGQSSVFVVTIWSDTIGHPIDEIGRQLSSFGSLKVVSFALLYWKYAQTFLPYFGLDLPHKTREQVEHIHAAAHLWAADTSRAEYLAQLRWRLLLDFGGLSSTIAGTQYFPGDLFSVIPDEVFVDCGAFDGDTIRYFLEQREPIFDRLIAIEPDPLNFSKLATYVEALPDQLKRKIAIHQVATGISRGKVQFNSTGTNQANVVETGNIEVDCMPLDELLFDLVPTYIKMDIEGAEPETLQGARRIIKKYSPTLSLCISPI